MAIMDIGIIIFLLFGAVLGLKRGCVKQLVNFLGFILVAILAFKARLPVSDFLFKTLPFFKFKGVLKGAVVLNIVLYEFLAFIILFSILMIAFRIIMLATRLFEKILNTTIILGIPFKILGAILGVIEHYIIVFIVLLILTIPFFENSYIVESKYKDKILNKTPILTDQCEKTKDVIDRLNELKEKFADSDINQFNLDAIDLLLDKGLVNLKTIDKLIAKNKLQVDNIEIVLQRYR